MSAEYNSKLISRLYNIKYGDYDSLFEILSEVNDIKDSVFLFPLLDYYKKDEQTSDEIFKSISYLDTPKKIEILLEIARKEETSEQNFSELVSVLADLDVFEKDITSKIIELLINKIVQILSDSSKKNLNFTLFLYNTLPYLYKSKELLQVRDLLRDCLFFNEIFTKNEKEEVLDYLLKLNPGEELDYLISIHDKIKNTDNEIIITKEIIKWKGSKIENLKKIILENGGERAKEIIKKDLGEKNALKEKERQDDIKENFSNASLLYQINQTIDDINRITELSEIIGFKLLEGKENLTNQMKTADNENDLKQRCLELRDSLNKISEKVPPITEENNKICSFLEINKEHLNKPINRLQNYLLNLEVEVNDNFFGIRDINRFCSLFGSHQTEEVDELKKISQKLNIYEPYTKSNWRDLHEKILLEYKQGIEKIKTAIEKKIKEKE